LASRRSIERLRRAASCLDSGERRKRDLYTRIHASDGAGGGITERRSQRPESGACCERGCE
jgi:hypothetical protein